MSNSVQPHRRQPARFFCSWDSPGKNTRVDCHILLQGIFLTQGLNPHLLNWQADSLSLSTWEAQFICATTYMQSLIVIVVLWSWQMYSPSSLRVNLDTHLKVSTAFLHDILESCTLGAGHLSTGGQTHAGRPEIAPLTSLQYLQCF